MQSRTEYTVQRRYQRYVFSESLDVIHRAGPNDTSRCPGLCMEISEGGMSAIVTEPLQVGDEVELSFEATGNKINVKAIVRNRHHFRHGLEFVCLDEDTRKKIREACASLKPYEGSWY